MSAAKNEIDERLFREALYAVFNFGYGYENSHAGADNDEGMELAVKTIFGGVTGVTLTGNKADGYNRAMAFWKELACQPDPVAYTNRQIELGLAGERSQ